MRHAIATLFLTLGLAGCDTPADQQPSAAGLPPTSAPSGFDLPAGHPAIGPDAAANTPVAGAAGHSGTVAETMSSAGFTYVRLNGPNGEVWLAAPETAVAVGDQLSAPLGSLMTDFQSPSLGRSFAQLYMVGSIAVQGATAPATGAPTAASPHLSASAETLSAPVAPLEGGHTIAQLYTDRARLAGKEVAVRGQVVKVNPGIMDRTWVHLQDGSGDPGANTHDLTLTTDQTVVVGQIVVARGTLATDRDFGMGYQYEAIVEGARFE